ncbi:MAG: hypothetical protein IT260_14640 [Saprospiraceae bacterium]|nr:hypothetical protein [Saprospiraceae bacterium]
MIFYGKKGSVLRTEQLTGLSCPNCTSKDALYCAVAGSYAHIYWIPFFPLGKTLVSQCTHCKQVLEEKDMPHDLREHCQYLKQETKTPIWYFSGIAVIAVLIVIGSISSKASDKENQARLAAPLAGDRYEIKTQSGDYTVIRITRIAGDTVFFNPNQYSVNKIRGLNDLDKAENFLEEEYGILRADLNDMSKKGKIIDINR